MAFTRIRHDLHARVGVVEHIADLSSRMRRITVLLDEDASPVPWVPLAVGDHVKLALPHPTTGELNLAGRDRDRDGDADAGSVRPTLRDYTIRAVPDERRVVVDVLVQSREADAGLGEGPTSGRGGGPGSTWGANAGIGTPIGVLGPRGSHVMPDDRRRYLCLVDESALAVAARWLEEAPAGAVVDVAIEATNSDSVPDLPAREHGSVTVVAGTDGCGLVAHLRELRPAPGDLVWAAGEAGSMLAVRGAAAALGVDKTDLQISGYWKRGVAGRDHHAPLDE